MSEGLGELTSVMDQIGGIVRYAFPFGFGNTSAFPRRKSGVYLRPPLRKTIGSYSQAMPAASKNCAHRASVLERNFGVSRVTFSLLILDFLSLA